MARKTYSDHHKEYSDALLKLTSIQSRIERRAQELIKTQPDVIIGSKADIEQTPMTVKEYYDEFQLYLKATDNPDYDLATTAFLKIIKSIEEHNLKQAGIVQTTMFPKS